MQSIISRRRESTLGPEKKGEGIERQSTFADQRRNQLFKDAAVIVAGFSALVGGGIGAGAALGIIPRTVHKSEVYEEIPAATVPSTRVIYAGHLQELGKMIRK
jgi:hypothetical protein